MPHKNSIRTDFLFILFAMLWGASYPITQSAIGIINPFLFVFFRFAIAALVMLPFIMKEFKINWVQCLKVGMLLGLLNTAIYTFEALSLKYTSVSRSAFIMGSNVIIVPFLAQIFRISRLTLLEIFSAAFFLLGLYILTGSHFDNLNQGDILALFGAIAIASSITYLQHISHHDFNPIMLTFFQLVFTCPIPFLLYLSEPAAPITLTFGTILAIGFCGILATTIPLLGQIKFQKYTTAAQTASIFALEPIFACLFAYLFCNDKITLEVILGGMLMLISAMFPMLIKYFRGFQYEQ